MSSAYDKEWLKRYYDQVGREITLAFNTINVNTGWAFTLFSLLVSGIFLSGVFPDIRTFSVLLLISVLLIRFFVRTSLGYQNLIRWNKFRNSIDKIFLGADANGSIETDLRKSIAVYDWRWVSPIPRHKLFLSNLRYGFWAMFLLTFVIAVYAWFGLDKSSVTSPSPTRSIAIEAVFLTVAFLILEIKGLYDRFYFKYVDSRVFDIDQGPKPQEQKPADQLRRQATSIHGQVLKNKRWFYGATIILLCAASLSLLWTNSTTTVISPESPSVNIDGFSLRGSLALASGDEISLRWYADSAVTVVLVDLSSIQDLNKTGVLSDLADIYYGQSGSVTKAYSTNITIGILVRPQSTAFMGEIQTRGSPYACVGIVLGVLSLLPILAVMLAQRYDLIDEETRKSL